MYEKKQIMSVLAALTCAICTMEPLIVSAESSSDTLQYGEYLSYVQVDEDDNGTYDYVEITGCDTSAVSVDIPSEIDGLPVTSIGHKAFAHCGSLESITIENPECEIDGDSFTISDFASARQ